MSRCEIKEKWCGDGRTEGRNERKAETTLEAEQQRKQVVHLIYFVESGGGGGAAVGGAENPGNSAGGSEGEGMDPAGESKIGGRGGMAIGARGEVGRGAADEGAKSEEEEEEEVGTVAAEEEAGGAPAGRMETVSISTVEVGTGADARAGKAAGAESETEEIIVGGAIAREAGEATPPPRTTTATGLAVGAVPLSSVSVPLSGIEVGAVASKGAVSGMTLVGAISTICVPGTDRGSTSTIPPAGPLTPTLEAATGGKCERLGRALK